MLYHRGATSYLGFPSDLVDSIGSLPVVPGSSVIRLLMPALLQEQHFAAMAQPAEVFLVIVPSYPPRIW